MIRHMRHGSSPRLMTPQPIRGPNRREALATPSAGDRMTRAAWAVWQAGLTRSFTLPEDLPPLRLLLVGQSGRPQDARPGAGAVRAGRHAALHTRGRQLAQQGGVNRACSQAPRAGRTAPASPRRDRELV